jgi:hypothetical protein
VSKKVKQVVEFFQYAFNALAQLEGFCKTFYSRIRQSIWDSDSDK